MTVLHERSFFPGQQVKDQAGIYTVLMVLNGAEVVVEDESGVRSVKSAAKLNLVEVAQSTAPDLESIPEKKWNEVKEIVQAITPLIEKGPYKRTKDEVRVVADKFLVHPVTIYRWIKEYEESGTITSLLRQSRSDKGQKKLDPKMEVLIEEAIRENYLTSQRKSIAATYREVERLTRVAGMRPPTVSTVRKRILAIPESERVAKREGYKEARDKFSPQRGSFPGADYPLAVVQIDHTPMDVIVVDDKHRKPIGRPFLTIAIDVNTRVCLGFYISLDHPGTLATGVCISRSILHKDSWLKEMELSDPYSWPCWGMMKTIHVDNAKEFRGTMISKACAEYGVILTNRPKGNPKYGGHVERAFGTFMSKVHDDLPGTTFSNPAQRFDYDSEKHAVLTFNALERWFTTYIVGVYNQSPHEGIDGLPPVVKWERGNRIRGIPAPFPDEEKVRLDFMPFQRRTVQEYGISMHSIYYWNDALKRLIHAKSDESIKKKKQFVVRYDPRDLSRVWLYEDESGHYIEATYRNMHRPAISLWEVDQAKARLREDSKASTNEELIFRAIMDLRDIVESESEKTKAARKAQQKMKAWEKAQKKSAEKRKVSGSATKPVEPVSDERIPEDFDDFEPFEDIREAK